jgi:translation elongation factor EF-4
MVEASILTPPAYVGPILLACKDRRAQQTNLVYLDENRVSLTFHMPWQDVVSDFYNTIKTITSGYASLHYRDMGAQDATQDIIKVDIWINGHLIDALSQICHRSKADRVGRALCLKLKHVIDRQQYEIVIQASLGGKVVPAFCCISKLYLVFICFVYGDL